MNAPETLEAAIQLAVRFHAGQRDKAGECYVLHLMRVMLGCTSPEAMQAGILHDLLEDTTATQDDLRRTGLSEQVVSAVLKLTKPEHTPYSEYIILLAADPIAREVKLADLEDNYRLARVAYRAEHADEDSRRIQRYILSAQFLRGQIARNEFLERIAPVDTV